MSTTSSHSVTVAKQRPARLGLGWVTIRIGTFVILLAILGPTQAG